MKNKILVFGIIIFGILSWYLFVKPYDYLVTFKADTTPGTINQTIKLWSKTKDPSAKIFQKEINNLSSHITLKDTVFSYDWKLMPLSDSTSQIKVYVRDINHSLVNKLKIPFSKTNFEKTTIRELQNFNKELTKHLKSFKVRMVGRDTLVSTYCAYVSIKSTQAQKAREMMKNYAVLNNFVGASNIQSNGAPMIEITKWDIKTDSIHYNFCYPIIMSDSLPINGQIKYKYIKSKPSLKAIYNGNYMNSDRAWYSLIDYAKRNSININNKPIEVFNSNPNMGGYEIDWHAEIFMPIE